MPSINLKFLEINPANLLGKLHQAAVAKVQDKFGKDIIITNSFIDIEQVNDPKAVLKNGEYFLTFRMKKEDFKNDKKKIIEPVIEYVRWFAGDDVAKKVQQKGGNWFTQLFNWVSFGKMWKKSTASELEKGKTEGRDTTKFTLKYTIKIKEGTLEQGEVKKESKDLTIDLGFEFLTESLSFNPATHYNFVKQQLLKESMKKNAEKIIKNISKKNFTEANKLLSELIQQKMNARVEDVLSTQSDKK